MAQVILVCVFMLSALFSGSATAAGEGKIKFERRSHNFGQVIRGQVLKYRFKFKNDGLAPLKIQGVHAACGCTAVEADKGKMYAAGESGYVDLTLDTSDFTGSMTKVVTVMTNEKITPDRTLTVRAKVFSEFEVYPPLVDFGDVLTNDGATKIVKVSPIKGFSLVVKKVGFSKDVLDASFAKKENDWIVTVKLKPGLKTGFFKDAIVIETNSKELPSLSVPVRGTIRGNILVAPNYLEFGAVAKAAKVKRDLSLSGLQEFDIVGTKAELIINGKPIANASDFVIIAEKKSPSSRKKVAIELINGANQSGSVHGKLFLETSDKSSPKLEVDFYAFFR